MMEHRWGRRYDTDVAVRFVALPATIGSGRVTNISLSGAFMETRAKLSLLTVIYIEGMDSATERGKPATSRRLAATVVRRCSAGVGLEWCDRSAWRASTAEPEAEDGRPLEHAAAASAETCVYRLDFID
jgi:hypothetical protein